MVSGGSRPSLWPKPIQRLLTSSPTMVSGEACRWPWRTGGVSTVPPRTAVAEPGLAWSQRLAAPNVGAAPVRPRSLPSGASAVQRRAGRPSRALLAVGGRSAADVSPGIHIQVAF